MPVPPSRRAGTGRILVRMSASPQSPVIVLVAGHWLGAWAWDEVIAHLRRSHDAPVTLTLPGLDPRDPERRTRTLDDQAEAIIARMLAAGASADRPAVLVGHSGANAPVCTVMDRRPELVAHVVWVDTGPVGDGTVFEPDLPADVTEVVLPEFAVLSAEASMADADALAGLDPEALERFRRLAVPEPATILRARITLHDEARRRIPTTMVCCSISAEQITAMVRAAHPMVGEIAATETLALVDLPTGHWPMWSRAEALARIIHEAGEASARTH